MKRNDSVSGRCEQVLDDVILCFVFVYLVCVHVLMLYTT